MRADSAERSERHAKRQVFDAVAELYDSCRPGYPAEIVAEVVSTSGVRAGSSVLEIGCGTGQLTRQLAPRGFTLTAIDLGPSMIEIARRRLAEYRVALQVMSFENYAAPDREFDLIVSATAFHWIDPEIAWKKGARLLVPGGWLAILSSGEHYDEPLGSALTAAWIRWSEDGGAWARAKGPTVAAAMAGTGLFGPPVTRSHRERSFLPAEVVLGLELTRATSLSYDEQSRESFRTELTALLAGSAKVGLEQQTWLTMGRSLGRF